MPLPTATDEGRFAVLLGGYRVEKDDPRLEACGEVDELNCALGLALTHLQDPQARAELQAIQSELLLVGSLLADPDGRWSPPLPAGAVDRLTGQIHRWQQALPPLQAFILPGGPGGAAELHLARAIARRVERRLVPLVRGSHVPETLLTYLNRLSDYLFVLARAVAHAQGMSDTVWHPPGVGSV